MQALTRHVSTCLKKQIMYRFFPPKLCKLRFVEFQRSVCRKTVDKSFSVNDVWACWRRSLTPFMDSNHRTLVLFLVSCWFFITFLHWFSTRFTLWSVFCVFLFVMFLVCSHFACVYACFVLFWDIFGRCFGVLFLFSAVLRVFPKQISCSWLYFSMTEKCF